MQAPGSTLPPPYLHGYSDDERARLGVQARAFARWVHRDLPFADRRRLLEIGCGTGAQLELVLEAFPDLAVTGVDHAEAQLATARRLLAPHAARTTLVHADAARLPFADGAFDAAFLCWILEHVPDPAAVVRELHRVLAPGAPVVITEVVNATLFIDPPAPRVMRYWDAFNAHQRAIGGDPCSGAKLGHYLHHAGFRQITTRPADIVLDDRDPAWREVFCGYYRDLLLSAAPGLVAAGRVERGEVDAVCAELDAIGRGPGTVFFYAFVQARCVR